MSYLFWNCRGLGIPLTVLTLRDIIRLKNPDIIFRSETKSTSSWVDSLKERWNLHGITVDKLGQARGLALLWKKDVDVTLVGFSQNHTDAEILLPSDAIKCEFIGFYGVANRSNRWKSWALLRHLPSNNSLPWMVRGDFNDILTDDEKCGGLPRNAQLMEAFRVAISDCELVDLGYKGDCFTWTNNITFPHDSLPFGQSVRKPGVDD